MQAHRPTETKRRKTTTNAERRVAKKKASPNKQYYKSEFLQTLSVTHCRTHTALTILEPLKYMCRSVL